MSLSVTVKSVSSPACPRCRTALTCEASGSWRCLTCHPRVTEIEIVQQEARSEVVRVLVTRTTLARIERSMRESGQDSKSAWGNDAFIAYLDREDEERASQEGA